MENEKTENGGFRKVLKFLPIFLVLAAIIVYCIVIVVSDKPKDKKPASDNTSANTTSQMDLPTATPTAIA